MSSLSPTSQGFRIIFTKPAIPLAEVAWRWSFAAAAWFLGGMFLIEYADSLPVTQFERVMLGTNQPALVGRALQRIFQGSAFRFTSAAILLALALTFAWIILASLGRAATLKALMEDFRIADSAAHPGGGRLSSLIFLNALRAAVTLAAIVAGIGSIVLASSLWASTHVSVADAGRLFMATAFFVTAAWATLNWLLSTAPIFLTPHNNALDAIAGTVRLCHEYASPLLAASTWFSLAHFAAFIAASIASFMVMGAAGTLHGGLILFLEFGLFLAYCVVADVLCTGRLAAYMAIVRGPGQDKLKSLQPSSLPPAAIHLSAVDRDELILSDHSLPVS